jgi:chromate reductase, NAD(P)H dehydrogenase (quinone)
MNGATSPLRVLGICGSLRRGSFNAAVLRALPVLAPDNMKVEMAPSLADFPLYNADMQNEDGFPQPAVRLKEMIEAADGLVFVSPEYNFSIPGVLKNAIDWVSRFPDQPFKGKPILLQSAAIGVLGGARMQYHLRQTMVFLEAIVFTKPEVFVTFAKSKIDEEGRLHDEQTREVIRGQLAAFEGFVRQIGHKPD